MNNQQLSKKPAFTLAGIVLLLISLCIYTVAWIVLDGKGSGAGFELSLIWTPLAYLFLLPGSILLLRHFRRTDPVVVIITGALLIVFDHLFSATLETGNTSGYTGMGAVVNFVIGLIAIPLVVVGLWLIIEGIIRFVRWRGAKSGDTSSRMVRVVALIVLVGLFLLDVGLTWWIYSSPACAGFWWLTATCHAPFHF